ncbi:MAG: acetyl-CoA carboxylase, biotin carboxyl carrier protein, partial [Ruminococcaceae bacterium]|nr:acetyl-CoA carboxylase, biotin carboxyl carrier protein [Oscillospiraceae bacterium]
ELMKELGLTGLEITAENSRVRLERSMGAPIPQTVSVVPPARQETTEDPDYISVRSPMVGVFYTAPAENAAPYVAVGDRVSRGQILCIVEAMKLMNEIYAEDEGVIAEVCAENGQVVEFGTELFRLRRGTR